MLRNLIIVYISCVWQWSQAELYTSISEIETLLDSHQQVIVYLDDYLQNEEKRLSVLRQHLNIFKTEQKEAMRDIPNYIGNPVNAFTLIKRLTTDLEEIEQSINISTNYVGNLSIIYEDVLYPTAEDLTGAAQALTRLQETYQLSTTDLSDGILNGLQYWSPEVNLDAGPMSSSDCYELGKALYFDKSYKNSIPWMKEALRKYRENPDDVYPYTEVDILEYISFTYYLLNDFRSALQWTAEVLAIDPKHDRVSGNVPFFQELLREQEAKQKRSLQIVEKSDTDEDEVITKEKIKYEKLCRGEMELPNVLTDKLSCRYLTEGLPFLRIAPIKMEQYYIMPDIFLFYDVMSDDEIEAIKEMAKPRFKRAVVQDPESGGLVRVPYRISKSAWLKDDEGEVVARISQRITDFTGLSMVSSEEIQVVNYGIGGQYEAHYDFARKHETGFPGYSGNRIATVLFYMSNVAQGGATVFPDLGLTIFPVKNAALFWYNLHPSGQGDLATLHAACPVLRGSKWVSTKWIHEGGQELIKLCGLKYQEEGIIHKPPQPLPKSSRKIKIT